MTRTEWSRWAVLFFVLLTAHWAFSFPVEQRAALLAQAAAPVKCQSKTKAMSVEEECKPGCEYTIRPSRSKIGAVDVTAAVSDPTGKQPGTVKYSDGKGTVIMLCNGTVGQSLDNHATGVQSGAPLQGQGQTLPPGPTATMLPTIESGRIETAFAGSSGSYVPTPLERRESVSSDFFGTGSSGSLGAAPNPATNFNGDLGGNYCLGQFCPVEREVSQQRFDTSANGGSDTNIFGNVTEMNPVRVPQNVGIENALIGDAARLNMSGDERMYSAAQQWSGFQQNGQLNSPKYIGADSETTVAQSINASVRDYAQQDVGNAVAEVTGLTSAGPSGVLVSFDGDKSLVRDPYDGSLIFSRVQGSQPTLYTADGQAVPTSNQTGDWVGVMKERIQTPAELQVFEQAYTGTYAPVFTPADIKVQGLDLNKLPEDARNMLDSYARWDGNGPESSGASSDVVIRDLNGQEKVRISNDVFQAIQSQENQVYGIDAAASRIERDTQGKMSLNISGLPQETDVGGSLAPAYALTPLPGEMRTWAASAIETELSKYPSEYWENANKGTIYDFAPRADMPGVVREGGHATLPEDSSGHIFINGNSVYDPFFATTLDHELAHYNDNRTFMPDSTFGTTVYGPAYGMSYAGASGYEAITSGKFDIGRPEGFAESYGYRGGIQEDKATIVGAMFTNYPAVQEAMQTDAVLAQKVQILQSGFEKATNGVMNEAYWQNLRPINSSFQLPSSISKPNFLQTLMAKFGLR